MRPLMKSKRKCLALLLGLALATISGLNLLLSYSASIYSDELPILDEPLILSTTPKNHRKSTQSWIDTTRSRDNQSQEVFGELRRKTHYQTTNGLMNYKKTKTTDVGSVILQLREKQKHVPIISIDLRTNQTFRTTYTLAQFSSNVTLYNQLFDNSKANQTSLTPWPNVTTLAFYEARLRSGFRNQMMCVTILILECILRGHGQFLYQSIPQKDTYGSNKNIPFDMLWDIPHWNSFYPRLPRFVKADPILQDQWNPDRNNWFREELYNTTQFRNVDHSLLTSKPEHPYAFGFQRHLMSGYIRYAAGKGPYTQAGHRHPAEILMLQGALRPSPALREIIQEKLQTLDGTSSNETVEYMTLHARVEPDMQRQQVCVWKKVLNLTHIFEFMESKWTDPPALRVFMPINRQFLEKEGSLEVVKQLWADGKAEETNWMAVENLKALNKARDEGLWGGRAKVFEFGSNVLNDTIFEHRPSTTGAVLNFFVGINANVFIGTEVSSYSHDLLATRFYRGKMENYMYLPEGLVHWTPPGLEDPPGFHC